MGKLSLLATALAVASPCAAQSTVDGDTLKQAGVTYRLWGIDAPEAKQVCPDGWPASMFRRGWSSRPHDKPTPSIHVTFCPKSFDDGPDYFRRIVKPLTSHIRSG